MDKTLRESIEKYLINYRAMSPAIKVLEDDYRNITLNEIMAEIRRRVPEKLPISPPLHDGLTNDYAECVNDTIDEILEVLK